MKVEKISELKKVLNDAIYEYSSIGLVTHMNPDGDGFCAALALQEILKKSGKTAKIVLEEPAPAVYEFLKGKERSEVYTDELQFDLLILLDCHEAERIGKCSPLISKAQKIIAIDHHIQNNLIPEALTFIDPEIVSTGVIIFKLFREEIDSLPEKSRKFVSEAIYTTIINDSDNFLNANVNEDTYRVCAQLMKYDLKPGEITKKFLFTFSAAEMRFIGETLSTIETYEDDQILFMSSTLEMLRKNNLTSQATEKMTRWVKGIKKNKIVVYFQEIGVKEFRLSFRSEEIDVYEIAVYFGGGGHQKASGCKINGTFEEVKKKVLAKIKEKLHRNKTV